ncbi:MAG: phospholipase D-like domain-containing protein [Streptosporangiaceae bacterium]
MNAIPPGNGSEPEHWLLGFTAADPHSPAGDGRPWGDGTAMAARAYAGHPPWDTGNEVTPIIGGFLALNAIRDVFEEAIDAADLLAAQGVPPGQRGHVYIAGWGFNAQRDTSTDNAWGDGPWQPGMTARKDQTALGLVIRMMSAGITVRLLLWMPTAAQHAVVTNLADEHRAVAAAVQDHNVTLERLWQLSQPIGVAALDLRIAAAPLAALHQKAIVVRVGTVHAAFCGGVDLAFTRRDVGLGPDRAVGKGDWQSGEAIPRPADGWPRQDPPPAGGYPAYPYPGSPLLEPGAEPEQLPAAVFGRQNQHWHDHHLRLRGPIVATLEQQFAERWVRYCAGGARVFDREAPLGGAGQAELTSAAAVADGQAVPLPAAEPAAPAGSATVQMWRTIPLCPGVTAGPFTRGEFTVMSGLANAVSQAAELITIWDQCFWSEPLARLLAARLMASPGLRLLIVIPPYGNDTQLAEMELTLRRTTLRALWHGLDEPARARVAVRDMWAADLGVGVYVHAKSQTYDDRLLVCGSANLNRRSTECDAELDCAVLHQPTVTGHLARLYSCLTGRRWSDTGPGWLTRYWTSLTAPGTAPGLIVDPFFAETIGSPATPNGVPMPYSDQPARPEPTSIGSPVETGACQFPDCTGEPKAPGRLDQIAFLLERCHQGDDWPWRRPAT